MATKAEKVLKTQTFASRGFNPRLAAIKYVNSGLNDLGLKPREKNSLKEKLIPMMEKRITLDRSRTAARAKGIVNREAKTRVKKAMGQ
jgi:hypothetical protein